MHIQYEDYSDLISEEKGFGKKIVEEIVSNIAEQVTEYCQERAQYFKETYHIDVIMDYDILRSNQAIIDTLEDLMRLKEFHPVEYPNRLKCAAYMTYWWIQRKPITFTIPEEQEEVFFSIVSKRDIATIIHANEFWLVAYALGEIFSSEESECIKENPKFEKQWDTAMDYIFYYFCYRVKSAKEIEAFLSTAILHPIWKIKEGVFIAEEHL